MHRIDTPGSVSGSFDAGNAVADIDGTIVSDDFMNALQEELSGVIESTGVALDKGDNGQLLAALVTLHDTWTARRFSFTAGSNLTAGDPLLIGDVFGVVEADVTIGNPGVLLTRGKFQGLPKAAADAITAGDRIYWNDTNGELTVVAAGAVSVGYADADAGAATTTMDAALTGPPNV